MTTPEFRTLDAGEVRLHAAVHGEGPLVLMVHGFPESWYSWRHQIPAIAAAGFTACAIDVPGLRRLRQALAGRGLRHG